MELNREHAVETCHPREIDLYGAARATLESRRGFVGEIADQPFLVALRVLGEERGLCAVGFDRLPSSEDEASMLVELANILASKFITQLADLTTADIMVSPPTPSRAGEKIHSGLGPVLRSAQFSMQRTRAYSVTIAGGPALRLRFAFLKGNGGGEA